MLMLFDSEDTDRLLRLFTIGKILLIAPVYCCVG
jgi:hypothetical protein